MIIVGENGNRRHVRQIVGYQVVDSFVYRGSLV